MSKQWSILKAAIIGALVGAIIGGWQEMSALQDGVLSAGEWMGYAFGVAVVVALVFALAALVRNLVVK